MENLVYTQIPNSMVVDVETLKKILRMNFHNDIDVVDKDGKLYVVMPLDVLLKYERSGDKIILKFGV